MADYRQRELRQQSAAVGQRLAQRQPQAQPTRLASEASSTLSMLRPPTRRRQPGIAAQEASVARAQAMLAAEANSALSMVRPPATRRQQQVPPMVSESQQALAIHQPPIQPQTATQHDHASMPASASQRSMTCSQEAAHTAAFIRAMHIKRLSPAAAASNVKQCNQEAKHTMDLLCKLRKPATPAVRRPAYRQPTIPPFCGGTSQREACLQACRQEIAKTRAIIGPKRRRNQRPSQDHGNDSGSGAMEAGISRQH
jgi:hypothetical protein